MKGDILRADPLCRENSNCVGAGSEVGSPRRKALCFGMQRWAGGEVWG